MRLRLACLLVLAMPSLATGQTSQYLFGSQSGQSLITTGQFWTGLIPRDDVNVEAGSPSTGTSYALMPTTGTFSSFCVNLTTAPGTGASWTWTLYKNGLDEYLSVTISGAEKQACDLVDTAGFVPGDLVALHVTPSSSPVPAASFATWYIVQTPAVPGETILFGSQQVGNAQYLSLAGNSSSASTEAQLATIVPTTGTVTRFMAEYAGTGSSVEATLDHNGSASPIAASLSTSGTFVEQAANLSVSAGDFLDVYETGITASSAIYSSVVFVPSVPGQFVIPTWRNVLSNADPLFYLPITGRSDDNLQPDEAQAQQIGDNLQIQAIFAQTTAAPGSGAGYAFTLRDNGTGTALSAAISGTSQKACATTTPVTGCSTGSPLTVNNFDLLDTSVSTTGSPANSFASVSYLAYVPHLAFTTEPPATGSVGTALSPVVVELQDANGNPLAGSTAKVTISSSPAGVSGTLTANAVNGVATFSNLIFSTSGTYTLSANASGLTAITSSSSSVGTPTASLTSLLNFPSTVQHTTSAAMAATLSNTGTGSLTNIVPTILGNNPDDFAISTGANACGATLAAGASCSIYVTFTPSLVTAFSASLSVADSATGSPQTATLLGEGSSPPNSVSLTPLLNFPSTVEHTTSAAMAATLTNTGSNTVTGIVASIGGNNPDDFAFSTGANACGATLAAGASCSIYVTFTPSLVTAFSASLSVADSATGSPQTATLLGEGTLPLNSVSLTPLLNFPSTVEHTTSAAMAATLTNTGSATVTGIVASIGGNNPDDFALSTGANACGATLAAGASCSIYVTFTPSLPTAFSASLSVADSATGSPQTATLLGEGAAPASAVSLTPLLNFPSTVEHTTSAALAATLTNNSGATVTGIVVGIGGNNPDDFAISTGANACGATLAVGASCSIYVTFTPSGATAFSASLSVADSAAGSPQTAVLLGEGSLPPNSVSLTSLLNFPATTAHTTSAALAATLTNTGSNAVTGIVASIGGNNPDDFAISTGANACGATLAAGASCSIYVTFTPSMATAFSASLSVADSATGSPQVATLLGEGQ